MTNNIEFFGGSARLTLVDMSGDVLYVERGEDGADIFMLEDQDADVGVSLDVEQVEILAAFLAGAIDTAPPEPEWTDGAVVQFSNASGNRFTLVRVCGNWQRYRNGVRMQDPDDGGWDDASVSRLVDKVARQPFYRNAEVLAR